MDAATVVFGRDGFAAAKVGDIARAGGVSVGTIYNYVEGKDGLLLLTVVHAFGGLGDVVDFPVPTPDRAELVGRLTALLDAGVRVTSLEKALRSRRRPSATGFRDIVAELYDLIATTRLGADALERCASEIPELATVFYDHVRRGVLDQLSRYVARRPSASVAPDLVARYVVETLTWFARHRHHDLGASNLDDDEARAAAIDLTVTAVFGAVAEPHAQ